MDLFEEKTSKPKEDAKQAVFEYIEIYYNRKRTHSTLGYKSPFEYEKQKIFV